MPKYRYTAADSQGRPVAGRVEAAGPDEALRQLAELGLNVAGAAVSAESEPETVEEPLSTPEAVAVADEVARLAQAQLPLAPGLRAVAAELGEGRVARALGRIATLLERGEPIENALAAQSVQSPAHIRGLIEAGVRTGKLGEVLDDFVDIEQSRIELRRRIRLILAYPAFLFALCAAICLELGLGVIPSFAKMFADFDMELPAITVLLLWLSGPPMWFVLGGVFVFIAALCLLWALPGPAWCRQLSYWVPMIGPLRRWSGLSRFSRLLAILLRQNVPLPEALRLTAAGVNDVVVALGCRRAAADVEAGRPLAESLAMQRTFPRTMIPMVTWGQRNGSLAETFSIIGDMFESRAEAHTGLLDVLLIPVVLVLIVFSLGFVAIALFMPLIQLIDKLSG